MGKTYKNGADVKRSIDELIPITLTVVPSDPVYPDPTHPSPVVKRIWERNFDAYIRRRDILDQNLRTLYSFI